MEELVQQLVADFPQNPTAISRALRKLSGDNWHEFLAASVAALTANDLSQGTRYLVSLLLREHALYGALCDPALLSISQAVAIVRIALVVDPRFGVDFARRLTSLESIDEREAERILKILEEVSESMKIRPSLGPLLRHPSCRIRSKAALLIGRANRNPELAAEQVSDEDARVRANAVEALWEIDDPGCATVFYDAARDSHQRVAGNAIVGLYKLHHVSSIRLLLELAERPGLPWRITAAWAMGITASPRFQPTLTRLMNSGDAQLRQHAIRSLARIRQTSRSSQLAGALSISVHTFTSDPEGRTNLVATVRSGIGKHVPNLPPTDFLLRDGEQWIQDYSVQEHSEPTSVALGLLISATIHFADPGLLTYLDRQQPADQWCLQRYDTNPSPDPGPAPVPALSSRPGILGLDAPEIPPVRFQSAIQFICDIGALGKYLADDTLGSIPLLGFAGAFHAMVEAIVAVPGSRHLICVADATFIDSGDLSVAAARARRAKVAIHAVVQTDRAAGFFEMLCRDTGGGVYRISGVHEIPAILLRIQESLLDRYEISFTRTNPELQDVTVQICSPCGYGEPTTAAPLPVPHPPSIITASQSSDEAHDS